MTYPRHHPPPDTCGTCPDWTETPERGREYTTEHGHRALWGTCGKGCGHTGPSRSMLAGRYVAGVRWRYDWRCDRVQVGFDFGGMDSESTNGESREG